MLALQASTQVLLSSALVFLTSSKAGRALYVRYRELYALLYVLDMQRVVRLTGEEQAGLLRGARRWPAPRMACAARSARLPRRPDPRRRAPADPRPLPCPPPPAALHGGYNTISNHKGSALMLLVLMAGHTSTLYT